MNLLVTGVFNCAPEDMNILREMGNNVIFMQDEKGELPCDYKDVEGVICNGLFLHHPIEKFTSLSYIQLTSAGLDRVPVDYVAKKGITLHNARGVYSVPMAEFAVCGALQLYKQSRFFERNQQNRYWEKNRNILELSGKTVCIIGCGSVGNECAIRFSAFGCDIFGVDLYPREDSLYKTIYPLSDMNVALSTADIVILTLPLSEETRGLINKDVFESMKQSSLLINIARGAIVDTPALIDALKTKLFGAVLDVFEEEPLKADNPLWNMENVIITPHNSFMGEGNRKRLTELVISNLKRNK